MGLQKSCFQGTSTNSNSAHYTVLGFFLQTFTCPTRTITGLRLFDHDLAYRQELRAAGALEVDIHADVLSQHRRVTGEAKGGAQGSLLRSHRRTTDCVLGDC